MDDQLVLIIPVWFHPLRGHEVTNRGRSISGPLTWFRAPVHSGATRARLRARYGAAAERAAVWLYDVLCQLSAAQPLERRGTVRDQFGAPLTVKRLAAILDHEVQELQGIMDMLMEFGWVGAVLAPDVRRVLAEGAPSAPNLGANGAPDGRHLGAECAPLRPTRYWREEALRARATPRRTKTPAAQAKGGKGGSARKERQGRGESSGDGASAHAGSVSSRVVMLLRACNVSQRAAREIAQSGVSVQRAAVAIARLGAYQRVRPVTSPQGLLVRCLRDGIDEEWVRDGVIVDPPLPPQALKENGADANRTAHGGGSG